LAVHTVDGVDFERLHKKFGVALAAHDTLGDLDVDGFFAALERPETTIGGD
jgi:hypothetical protein